MKYVYLFCLLSLCGFKNFGQNLHMVGLSPSGFGDLNLSTNTYSIINPNFSFGAGQGMSTFDQQNGRYIFYSGGTTFDTIVIVNALTGALLDQIKIPKNHLYNPEYNPGNNTVFGLSPQGFGVLDLNSRVYSVTNPNVKDAGAYQGMSTYDQVNDTYYYLKGGNAGIDTLVKLSGNGFLYGKYPIPQNHLLEPEVYNLKVYGLSANGFEQYDLLNNILTVLNPTLTFNNASSGMSTSNPSGGTYFFRRYNGTMEEIVEVAFNTGNVLAKYNVPQNHLYNPELRTNTFLPASLEDNSLLNEISVFPNPVSGVLTVNAQQTIKTISILNLQNQIVRQINCDTDKLSLALFDLAKGLYFIKVYCGENYKTMKFIKD